MGRYRTINVNLDRGYRNDLNQNFTDIERDILKNEADIKLVETETLEKVNEIVGGGFIESLETARDAANASSTEANTQAAHAKTQGDHAKIQGDFAQAQGDYAKLKGDYADEKAILASQAAAYADQEASNLGQLKIDVVNATQDANTAAGTAELKATEAVTAAVNATNQGDYAKAMGDYAKAQGDSVNEIIEGKAVTSINGKSGAVVLTASDLNAISQQEAQSLANQAEINAKSASISKEMLGTAGGAARLNETGKVIDADGNEVAGAVTSVNGQTGAVVIDVNNTEVAHFEYILVATQDGQTVFTIPLETFNSETDKLNLSINRLKLYIDDYSIQDKTITLLNDVVDIGESLYVEIIKNIRKIQQETLDGSLITSGTITKDKFDQNIVEILDNIPTTQEIQEAINVGEGNAKVYTDNKISEIIIPVSSVNGQTGDVSISIPTKNSELQNDSNFETVIESQAKADQAETNAKAYMDNGKASLETELKGYVDSEIEGISSTIGDIASLTTEDKTSLVNAINEANAKPSGGSNDGWELIVTHEFSPTAPLYTLYQPFTEYKRLKFILKSLAIHHTHSGTVAAGMLNIGFTDLSFGGYVSAGHRFNMMSTSPIASMHNTTRRSVFPLLSANIPSTTTYPHLETSGTVEINKSWWKSNENYGFMPRRLWVDTELRVRDPNSSNMNRMIERTAWEFPVGLNESYPARVGITTDRSQGFTTGTIEIWGVKGDANDV
ncbi:hypothetical protein [Cytobacillus praedii]|uniref:Uncharacterized protein n=1 Tax=Cytobacillus praedii TaxID=1742358 RepID=A0A4R1AU77_9BACI|nr:hypothetical protein [Cytobacillus praedii]TCJ01572.1 hypothetical protein E0Y62_23355 [Cytobacillus praedii]